LEAVISTIHPLSKAALVIVARPLWVTVAVMVVLAAHVVRPVEVVLAVTTQYVSRVVAVGIREPGGRVNLAAAVVVDRVAAAVALEFWAKAVTVLEGQIARLILEAAVGLVAQAAAVQQMLDCMVAAVVRLLL
jgi:hypothetical protein